MTTYDAMETPQSKVVKQKPWKWAKGKDFFNYPNCLAMRTNQCAGLKGRLQTSSPTTLHPIILIRYFMHATHRHDRTTMAK